MPAKSPPVNPKLKNAIRHLGEKIRKRRKELRISATTTAEAAGLSRVTLHRIELGEESVSIGAYINTISALGLELTLIDPHDRGLESRKKLPAKVRLNDFPQLKRLAWQLKGSRQMAIEDALEIYERNWRHVDLKEMDAREKEFLEALLEHFGRKRLLV
jgi:transcriptional regulator with XRE-family HTH domain